jgi:hypothetical protein
MRGAAVTATAAILLSACTREVTPCGANSSWATLVSRHLARYPLMQLPDAYKLLHQATMGSEHAMKGREMATAWMADELKDLKPGPAEPLVDTLGSPGRFARIHLRPYIAAGFSPDTLVNEFVLTATTARPDTAQLACALAALQAMGTDGTVPWKPDSIAAFVAQRRGARFGAIDHSEAFEEAYKPAYRVVALNLMPVLRSTSGPASAP